MHLNHSNLFLFCLVLFFITLLFFITVKVLSNLYISQLTVFWFVIPINILYGTDYLGAVPTLRIMIWVEMFAVMGTARGIWVLCENKSKYVKYFLGIGAVFVRLLIKS